MSISALRTRGSLEARPKMGARPWLAQLIRLPDRDKKGIV